MPEERKPIENPVLVDAMATFKLDLTNREHEMAFLQAAVAARYLLPAQVQPDPDAGVDENGQQRARIAFQIMTNQKGEQFMPVFTDEVELRKSRNFQPGERVQIAVMSFMDIYHFIKGNEPIRGVVINPSGSALCLVRQQVIAIGDHNGDLTAPAATAPERKVTIDPAQAQAAAQAQAQAERAAQAQAQQQAAIRQAMAQMEAAKASAEEAPAAEDVISDDLLDALKSCLKKQKAVKKAYIQPETDKGEQFLLIALEADENTDIDSISEQIAKDCADYSDLPFDCVLSTSIRAKELVANEKPFYEKKRFGIF